MLVAISIPIFTSQLEKSRETTDESNLRAAYAECMAASLSGVGGSDVSVTKSGDVITATKNVTLKQQTDNWEGSAEPEIGGVVLGNSIDEGTAVKVTVVSDGTVTFEQGSTNLKK